MVSVPFAESMHWCITFWKKYAATSHLRRFTPQADYLNGYDFGRVTIYWEKA